MTLNLENLENDYNKIINDLNTPEIYNDYALSNSLLLQKKQLEPIIAMYNEYKINNNNILEAINIINNSYEDYEIKELAIEQKIISEEKIILLEKNIKEILLEKNNNNL